LNERVQLKNPSDSAEISSKLLDAQTAIEQNDRTKAEGLIGEAESMLGEEPFPWVIVLFGVIFIIILVVIIMLVIPKINKSGASERTF
jgi:hypothetical protein